MKIVVLDGYTLNPGDLSWDGLFSLGPCQIYSRTTQEDVIPRAQDAGILLTNKTRLSGKTIAQLPALRYIGVLATGFDIVDVVAAKEQGIPVTNVPAYSTQSVAQMVFAHTLNLTQHVAQHAGSVTRGDWAAAKDFCYWESPLIELAGLTMGVVGFGQIGRTVAGLARAFGMEVVFSARTPPATPPAGTTPLPLDELLRTSDVVSLHVPLTTETAQMINAGRLALMKPSAFLINTARGALIDEQALADALNSAAIAGAGLDVLVEEPPGPDHPLLHARNCFVTPHIAWATRAARARLLDVAVDNIAAFLRGAPQNVVNP
ncbi:MAG: D-2-hydroxyacid dehydrogenase [Chloroflexi bacterium]|nr:D-2-hydroxyacid dehydrogenase [Chloroflexota bacterium]